MKHVPLRKSCIGLLVVTFASVPLASFGRDLLWAGMDEIQAQRQEAISGERGAQGPIREDTMQPTMSYGEDAFYVNLRKIQSTTTQRGAQGPIREDTMQPTSSYGEDAFYVNLRKIQSESAQ